MKSYDLEIGTKIPVLSETMLLTPLFRYNKNAIFYSPPSLAGKKIGSIFENMIDVLYTDQSIDMQDAIKKYGKLSEQSISQNEFTIKKWMKIFNREHDNLIPWLSFMEEDLEFARHILNSLDKQPIIINPFTGDYDPSKDNPRLIDIKKWQELINKFNKKYTFISISNPYNTLKDIITISDTTTFKQIAAIIKEAGLFLSIENGAFHVGVASGAKCICIMKDFPINGKVWMPNFLYTDNMWVYEEKRVHYIIEKEFDKINNIL